jgi:hypothetical protein
VAAPTAGRQIPGDCDLNNDAKVKLLLWPAEGIVTEGRLMNDGLRCHNADRDRGRVGPVLHSDDAVANKVCALFGRALPRDFLNVDASS